METHRRQPLDKAILSFSKSMGACLDKAELQLAADLSAAFLIFCNSHATCPCSASAQTVLGEALYLSALALLQGGVVGPADCILTALGCRLRLSRSMLQASSSQPAMEAPPGCQSPRLVCLPALLPPPLAASLCKGLSPASPYWAAHGGRGMPFSSHLFPIPRHGPDEAAMYGHPLEETVSALARCIASSPHPLAGALQQATHAEVWAHCRASDEAHQLHYDVDERWLGHGKSEYRVQHPLLSSVLFLAGEGAGATLVLEEWLGKPAAATRAWLVPPFPGSLLLFEGRLLHGVLPKPGRGSSHVEPRITLMVAWWGEEVVGHRARQRDASAPGPMMTPPWRLPDGHLSRHAWADKEHWSGSEDVPSIRALPSQGPHPVEPVWEKVPGQVSARQASPVWLTQLPLPPLRFFLRSETEIERLYGDPELFCGA